MGDVSPPQRRWFHPTPDRLILALLALEGVLLLSEQFRWFPLNQHKGWTVLIAVASVGAAMLLMLVWFAASLVFRWRFQFSVRSLFVLTVAVATACSWLSADLKKAREQENAIRAIEEVGGNAAEEGGNPAGALPPGTAWLRELLKDEFFTNIADVTLSESKVTNAGLEHLKDLTDLRVLNLHETQVTNAGLERVKGLTQLRELNLGGTRVTDAGLEDLKGLIQLQLLSLDSTQVTDAGLVHLKGLTQLRQLSLNGTQVTDAGMEHLRGLTQLNFLAIKDTPVTDDGVKKYQQALPNCRVYY
jgi:hypothetical protein